MSGALGVDYAGVDQDAPPDFGAAWALGVRFVIIRRSHTYWDASHQAWRMAHDLTYLRDAENARKAGMTVGSYLFPSFALHAPTPAAQVANFVAAEGDIQKGVDLPPCLDVEFPGHGVADTGRTQVDCLFLVRAFVDALRQAYGVSPMIYTSHVEMHDNNGLGLPLTGSWPDLADCALWQKIPYRLEAGKHLDTYPPAAPVLPAPWTDMGWWIRQRQGDALGVSGFSHTVDVDDFHNFPESGEISPHGDPRWCWINPRLAKAGYQTNFDGLRRFQSDQGLLMDGIVGPKTFRALSWI